MRPFHSTMLNPRVQGDGLNVKVFSSTSHFSNLSHKLSHKLKIVIPFTFSYLSP